MLLELNIKTVKHLNKYLELLKSSIYSGVSITSKPNNLDLITVLAALTKVPNLEIIPTFSCKANYNQSASQTYQKFLNFISTLNRFDLNQFLLVSGNPKMKLDTIQVLDQFNNPLSNIAIAYNPYAQDLGKENQKLVAKLKHQNVNQVWLQLGQDQVKLKQAIVLIKSINPKIQIINSVLLPTKSLLKSLQFRPWSGVFYSDEFYNNLAFALDNTHQMTQLSQKLGLQILISGA